MKKIILTCVVLLMAGCSKQETQNDKNNESVKVSSFQPFVKTAISDNNQTAQINYEQLIDIVQKTVPQFNKNESTSDGVTQFLPKAMSSKYEPFNTWMSIKVTALKNSTNPWGGFTSEAYDTHSYEESKFMAFQACKEVWKNIDDRVPLLIDELSKRIDEYEKDGSKPMAQHTRFGYTFILDASHYKDGYPIVCQIY